VAKKQISRYDGSKETNTNIELSTPLAQDIGQQIFEDIFDRPLPQLKEFKCAAEKTYLSELIRQCDGNMQEIMGISGLSRSHFYSLLKKYNLSH
jgi:two-component system NtrC family response regulator